MGKWPRALTALRILALMDSMTFVVQMTVRTWVLNCRNGTNSGHAESHSLVPEPSQATAYRELKRLEAQHGTFTGTTARNRDIATRPKRPYGKLQPTRPGEYVILDTTRLDVFGVDPITLRWTRIELTAAMDWHTRCIVGLRLTPVSTKAVDAAAMMFQVYRPPPAPASRGWPSAEVVGVGDVFQPVDGCALDAGLDGDMGHGRGLGGAVPMFDARWCPDDVTGMDGLLLAAPLLDPAITGGDDQGFGRWGGCATPCAHTE